jgi:hypothetical protein
MPGRRWNDLSERNRRLILVGGAVEAVLKVLALVDIAYFLVGRTKDR